MRCRDDEDLALDRIDAERDRGPVHPQPAHARLPAGPPSRARRRRLQAELTELRDRIGHYPEHLVDQLHAARSAQAEAQRVADEARARIAGSSTRPPAGWAAAARTPPSARCSANASSSPRRKSRRPPSASATSRAASPTARNGRPNAAHSASAPPSSTRSYRAAAASTYASRSSDQPPTSRQRWALSLTSRALAAPGSRPPRASRPTASTTPSPTPATHSDQPRATSPRVRTGNAPSTTSNALSETWVSGSTADTRTRSKRRVREPPPPLLRFVPAEW